MCRLELDWIGYSTIFGVEVQIDKPGETTANARGTQGFFCMAISTCRTLPEVIPVEYISVLKDFPPTARRLLKALIYAPYLHSRSQECSEERSYRGTGMRRRDRTIILGNTSIQLLGPSG